jgi:hypothetical protein
MQATAYSACSRRGNEAEGFGVKGTPHAATASYAMATSYAPDASSGMNTSYRLISVLLLSSIGGEGWGEEA